MRYEGVNNWVILVASLVAPENLEKLFGYLTEDGNPASIAVLYTIFSSSNFRNIIHTDLDKLKAGTTDAEEVAAPPKDYMETQPPFV
jgi:hypothetical protein